MAERMPYEDTTVRPETSMGQIRDLCIRYGATAFRLTEDLAGRGFTLEMLMDGLPLRLALEYGPYQERLRRVHPRTDQKTLDRQAQRVAWRWAHHYLKLVFEASEFGFQAREISLLAGFQGPDGRTLGETVGRRLAAWNSQGPALLGLPVASVVEAEFTQ